MERRKRRGRTSGHRSRTPRRAQVVGSRMNADCSRSEVYAAEVAAFDGTDLESVLPFETIARTIASVVAGEWWPGPPVDVQPARRDAASSSTRSQDGGTVVIRFAAGQLTTATAAHELAHALAGPAVGHSPIFLAAYLDVVEVITNVDARDRRRRLHVDQLGRSLDAAGLEVGRRWWPAPPDGISAAIAL